MKDGIFGVIYGIENLINHKIYVGQTIGPVYKRLSAHRKAKSYLGRAIRKHGWENFVWVILEECTSKEQLNAAEIRWIAKLNSKYPNGYNMNDGGGSNSGYKASKEALAKMSAFQKGRPKSQEHKDNIGKGNRGKKRSAETRALISSIQKGHPSTHNAEGDAKVSAAKRSVVFPNLDAELIRQNLTYREIARRLGISKSNVLDKLSGTRPIDKEMALAIREILQVEMPIEELFAKISDDGTIENATTFAKNRRIVFPNLEAELKAQNISHWELARRLNMNRTTLGNKLNGRNNLDKETTQAIYELLQVETPLEVLFARAEEFPTKTKKKPVVHHEVIFYPNLLAELKKRNLSYLELARLLGVNADVISKKMRGVYRLDRKTAKAIKELLQVEMPVEEFFATVDADGTLKRTTEFAARRKVLYPNLEAELERQNLTYLEISQRLGVHKSTIAQKMRGELRLDEKTALAIREILQVETPLEILFARADEGTSAPPVE